MFTRKYRYSILSKAIAVAVVCLFLVNDIAFGISVSSSEFNKFALAPPLATKPLCEIVRKPDGSFDVVTNTDVIKSWDRETVRSVRQGETLGKTFRNRWAFVDVGYLIGQMLILTQELKLQNPKDILIPLIKKHIRNRAGEAEMLLEGFGIDGIEEVREGEEIIGFSLPVTRNGTPTYKLIYNLQGGDTVIQIRDSRSVYVKVENTESLPLAISVPQVIKDISEALVKKGINNQGVLTIEGVAGTGKNYVGDLVKKHGVGSFASSEIIVIDTDAYLSKTIDDRMSTGKSWTDYCQFSKFERDLKSLSQKHRLVVVVGLFTPLFFQRLRLPAPDIRVLLKDADEVNRMRVIRRDGYPDKYIDSMEQAEKLQGLLSAPFDVVITNGEIGLSGRQLVTHKPTRFSFVLPKIYGKAVDEIAWEVAPDTAFEILSNEIENKAKLVLENKIDRSSYELSDVEAAIAGTFSVIRHLFSRGEQSIIITIRTYEKGLEVIVDGKKGEILSAKEAFAGRSLLEPLLNSPIPEIVITAPNDWYGYTFYKRWKKDWIVTQGNRYAFAIPNHLPKVRGLYTSFQDAINYSQMQPRTLDGDTAIQMIDGKSVHATAEVVTSQQEIDKSSIADIFPKDDYLIYLIIQMTGGAALSLSKESKEVGEGLRSLHQRLNDALENEFVRRQKSSADDIRDFYLWFAQLIKNNLGTAKELLSLVQHATHKRHMVEGVPAAENFVNGIEMLLDESEKQVDINDTLEKMLNLTLSHYYRNRGYKYAISKQLSSGIPAISARQDEIAYIFFSLVLPFQLMSKANLTVTTQLASGNERKSVIVTITTPQEMSLENVTTYVYKKNTGVGFELAKRLVQKYAGTIDVQSEIGKGTMFTLRLPVVSEPSSEQAIRLPIAPMSEGTQRPIKTVLSTDTALVPRWWRDHLPKGVSVPRPWREVTTLNLESIEKFIGELIERPGEGEQVHLFLRDLLKDANVPFSVKRVTLRALMMADPKIIDDSYIIDALKTVVMEGDLSLARFATYILCQMPSFNDEAFLSNLTGKLHSTSSEKKSDFEKAEEQEGFSARGFEAAQGTIAYSFLRALLAFRKNGTIPCIGKIPYFNSTPDEIMRQFLKGANFAANILPQDISKALEAIEAEPSGNNPIIDVLFTTIRSAGYSHARLTGGNGKDNLWPKDKALLVATRHGFVPFPSSLSGIKGGEFVSGYGKRGTFIIISESAFGAYSLLKEMIPDVPAYRLPPGFLTLRYEGKYYKRPTSHIDVVIGTVPYAASAGKQIILINPEYHSQIKNLEEYKQLVKNEGVIFVDVPLAENHLNPTNFGILPEGKIILPYAPMTRQALIFVGVNRDSIIMLPESVNQYLPILYILGGSIGCLVGQEVPSVAEKNEKPNPAPAVAITPDSERIYATNLQDTLTYVQAQPQTQPIIVALGTSWIKGYEKGRYLQYDALNPLIGSLRTYCESKGIRVHS